MNCLISTDITDTLEARAVLKKEVRVVSQSRMEKEKTMQKVIAHLKKEWKVYVVAIWMIGVTGFLYHLNGQIQAIKQTSVKLSSDVDSIESILISTDSNVAEVKKQVGEISPKIKNIHKRVMRR